MELDEFEIGELRAGARREREALAEGAGRIGAVLKEPADAAGRDDDAAGRQEQRAAAVHRRARRSTRAVLDEEPARLDAFEQA